MTEFEHNTIEDIVIMLQNYKFRPIPETTDVYERMAAHAYRSGEFAALIQIVNMKLDLLL